MSTTPPKDLTDVVRTFADEAALIYEQRTAGDYTWVGFLYAFLTAASVFVESQVVIPPFERAVKAILEGHLETLEKERQRLLAKADEAVRNNNLEDAKRLDLQADGISVAKRVARETIRAAQERADTRKQS